MLNNGGSFTALGPQATNASAITVSIDTTTAGDKSGVSTIDFVSNGSDFGLGNTALPSQDVAVTGQVFRLAQASAHTPEPVVINARVGDMAEQALSLTNTAANDGFSESLNGSIGGATGDVSASGAFSLLAAGATDNINLTVGIDTGTAGAKSGTATIGLESDGSGTSNIIGNVALSDQIVNVSGNVWAAAVADVQPDPVDFGIVHVGDTVTTQALAVSNIASGALTDVLRGGFGAVDGPFGGSGDLGTGVAAGNTDNSSLSVALDTSTAGVFNGTANLDLRSHDPDLADLMLTPETVGLTAQVNNFANPVFDFIGGDGAFSGGGDTFLLDFGDILVGNNVLANLAVGNDVPNPADSLDGTFDLTSIGLFFALGGFDNFTDLQPGQFINDLTLGLRTAGLGLGLFSGSAILNPVGFNGSGFREGLAPVTLAFRGNVVAASVPEPNVLLLMGFGLLMLFYYRRKGGHSV